MLKTCPPFPNSQESIHIFSYSKLYLPHGRRRAACTQRGQTFFPAVNLECDGLKKEATLGKSTGARETGRGANVTLPKLMERVCILFPKSIQFTNTPVKAMN